jgi:hypothetical protein
MKPRSGRLITAQPQDGLQPERTGAVRLAHQPIHGPEPIHKRFMRVLKNRSCPASWGIPTEPARGFIELKSGQTASLRNRELQR